MARATPLFRVELNMMDFRCGVGRRGVGCCCLAVSGKAPDQHVEDGSQQQPEERHTEHSGEHGDAQRMTNLGSRTTRHHQGHDAHDEGKRGHEDRAQAQTRGLQHGRHGIEPAVLLQMFRELHDEDRVLTRQTHEHDESHLREDIVVSVGEQDAVIAASRHIGTMRMMANGSVRLSYWAASTRNTNSTHSGNTNCVVLPETSCWYARSVHSKLMPRGKLSVRIFAIAVCACPELKPRCGAAVDVGGTIGVIPLHDVRTEGFIHGQQ